MSFSILYNDNVDIDMIALLTYINDLTKGMGISDVAVDTSVIRSLLLGMRQDFPHRDGLEKASAFKKIANFVTFFVSDGPILNPFPKSVIGPELSKIANHQNAMVGLQLAIDNLHGASISMDEKTTLFLKNRIKISKHSYIDIIDAFSNATHATHFKMITVLLEQLAYKNNPDCQYQLIDL